MNISINISKRRGWGLKSSPGQGGAFLFPLHCYAQDTSQPRPF